MEKTFTLSWDFLLKAITLVVCVYFLFLIKDILIWVIFALILAILFNFMIDFFEKKRVPRIVSVIGVYLVILSILGFSIYLTAPLLLDEIKDFTASVPSYLERISPFLERVGVKALDEGGMLNLMENNLEKAGEGIASALVAIFGGVKATLFIILLAFFFSLEKNLLERISANFAPKRYRKYIFNLLPRAKRKVSSWFLARVVGMIFVGGLAYITLLLLNVQYAFFFALMFGIFDFVPIIGPAVSGAFIVFVIFMTSPAQALFVLVALVIIQQLEGNLLFPILFNKFIGLPPSLVLIALVIGAQLWGLIGAILAIPLAGVIYELIKDYVDIRKRQDLIEIDE